MFTIKLGQDSYLDQIIIKKTKIKFIFEKMANNWVNTLIH